ncbi:unnamed protein product [Bursaphelenchus xylophilus]|uniref:(pine wood nematode) hypothetical protein n=1 Tax=Bursaphelenchus xylophilus TaxID=6326 RepID=A0A1I7RPN9_BURXY|nr:unnamed protein product [Bursaphelenchus xylophilus]CAG9096365.1 unnamed protein product [Bursaphelenchus xylophilus]
MLSPNPSPKTFPYQSRQQSPYENRFTPLNGRSPLERRSPLDARIPSPQNSLLSPRPDYGLTQYYDPDEGPCELAYSSPVRPVKRFEIQPWFEQLVRNKFFWASAAAALAAAPIFLLLVLIVQSSVLSPFTSVFNTLLLFLQLDFYLSLILACATVFVFSQIVCRHCFGMLFEQNYDVTKEVPLIACSLTIVITVLFWVYTSCAALESTVLTASGSIYVFFWALTLFASFNTAFSANFRWEFVNETPLNYFRAILPDLLYYTVIDTVRNAARSLVFTVLLSPLFSFTRSSFFDLILRAGLMINHFAVVLAGIVAVRFSFELLNAIVMQPLNLPMPTSTTFLSDETEKTQKNVLNAISSANLLLRIFGFQALYDLSMRSEQGRALIYSISQPAGKPRNWMAVRDACMESIEYIHELLAQKVGKIETRPGFEKQKKLTQLGPSVRSAMTPTVRPLAARALSGTATDLNEEKRLQFTSPSKARLLLPPNVNPRHFEAPKQKARTFSLSLSSFPLLNKWINLFKDNLLKPAPAIQTYYLIQAEYAINCLSVLTANSIKEDRFGIVQKDLAPIFSILLRLELAIDLYIRSTSNRKEDVMIRPNLSRLEDVLMDSIKRLYITYNDHIDSLELAPSERDLLNILSSNF